MVKKHFKNVLPIKTILFNISLDKDEHMYLTTKVNKRSFKRKKMQPLSILILTYFLLNSPQVWGFNKADREHEA